MIVMKFGGTSVGIPEHFRIAVQEVARRKDQTPIVVVSALSGVTNLLTEFCSATARRSDTTAALIDRHVVFAREAGLAPANLADALDAMRHDFERAPAGKPTPETRDRILSHGERLSSVLFAAGLRGAGLDAAAVVAGDAGLVTDERFGAAHPLPETPALLRASLGGRLDIPFVTGFLGRTTDGRTTTLGRGGSDYSAALIGAALGAAEIQIWTDTSGMLSADPRIVAEARTVPRLSFAEASELAYFGARVLHPKTLLPAVDREIPVRILNTLRPEDRGSLIMASAEPGASWCVKSIACKKGITAVTIVSTRMLLAHGFLARVFEVFGRHHVVVDLVTTSEVSISVTVDDDAHLDRAIADLEGIGRVEVRRGLGVIAVVGEGAPQHLGLTGHVFTLVGGIGVAVEMISQGASRVNLSFVVREADIDRVVRLLHRGLGLDLDLEAHATSGFAVE